MNIKQTYTPQQLEDLVTQIGEHHINEINNISEPDFEKLIDTLTAKSNELKSDLEKAVNLYNPKVHNLLEVKIARLLQYNQMLTPFLSFSKRLSEIISQREAKQENPD